MPTIDTAVALAFCPDCGGKSPVLGCDWPYRSLPAASSWNRSCSTKALSFPGSWLRCITKRHPGQSLLPKPPWPSASPPLAASWKGWLESKARSRFKESAMSVLHLPNAGTSMGNANLCAFLTAARK
ncbi:conserved hypothetical protein [Coccidioides posadasii str. Silveira]|uniref:Uncharacterized protein n=2 Tax=Coccidioides posadasii TaxID=199306 RepID=E9CZB0_COCPS|nr:conserved hypothetical protein [Coccidioides posadasii str. Silveira]KMM72881.1 hypothetical protein CPAG_09171 [Coccidioides posadasii RMSCC 3488]